MTSEREVARDCFAAMRNVLTDPIAPGTTPDRIAGLQASLDKVSVYVGTGSDPSLPLRQLVGQAMAWLVTIEARA
jgi:hypothetical protein